MIARSFPTLPGPTSIQELSSAVRELSNVPRIPHIYGGFLKLSGTPTHSLQLSNVSRIPHIYGGFLTLSETPTHSLELSNVARIPHI